jgi:hypothetical protein
MRAPFTQIRDKIGIQSAAFPLRLLIAILLGGSSLLLIASTIPSRPSIYSVAAVRTGLARTPSRWAGRTIYVRAMVDSACLAWMGGGNPACISRHPVLLDTPASGVETALALRGALPRPFRPRCADCPSVPGWRARRSRSGGERPPCIACGSRRHLPLAAMPAAVTRRDCLMLHPVHCRSERRRPCSRSPLIGSDAEQVGCVAPGPVSSRSAHELRHAPKRPAIRPLRAPSAPPSRSRACRPACPRRPWPPAAAPLS